MIVKTKILDQVTPSNSLPLHFRPALPPTLSPFSLPPSLSPLVTSEHKITVTRGLRRDFSTPLVSINSLHKNFSLFPPYLFSAGDLILYFFHVKNVVSAKPELGIQTAVGMAVKIFNESKNGGSWPKVGEWNWAASSHKSDSRSRKENCKNHDA